MSSSVYRSSDDYIKRQLEQLSSEPNLNPPTARMILDIADILTGPTSGGNAMYLAECLCKNRDPKEVADRLKEVADRYLATAIEEGKEAPPTHTTMKVKLCMYVDNLGDGSATVRFFNEKKDAEEYAEGDGERFCDDIITKTIEVDENGKLLNPSKR